MTGLIKSGVRSNVRAFYPVTPSGKRAELKVDPELAALRQETERLSATVAEQDAAITQHGHTLDRARADGEATGRKAGMKEADDGRTALAAKLAASSEEALRVFSRELSALERLAPLIAMQGLEKVFDDPAGRADIVLAIIRKQLETLEARSVVRLEVSPEDFPDEAHLPQAGASTGRPGLEFVTAAELKSGDCRIKLQLGSLEVGIDQQWIRLREILTEAAEPRAAR